MVWVRPYGLCTCTKLDFKILHYSPMQTNTASDTHTTPTRTTSDTDTDTETVLRDILHDIITVVSLDLHPGDVIKVQRSMGWFYHYGVYYGNTYVFHCAGQVVDGIRAVCGLSHSNTCEIIPIGVFQPDAHAHVEIERRTNFVNRELIPTYIGPTKYSIFTNNCEHIANYITQNRHMSHQVGMIIISHVMVLSSVTAGVMFHAPILIGLAPITLVMQYMVYHTMYDRHPIIDNHITYAENYPSPVKSSSSSAYPLSNISHVDFAI